LKTIAVCITTFVSFKKLLLAAAITSEYGSQVNVHSFGVGP
jgi:hypothetical protein